MRAEDIIVGVLFTGFIILIIYIITHPTNKPSSPNSTKKGKDEPEKRT